jgi:hypothetical protein
MANFSAKISKGAFAATLETFGGLTATQQSGTQVNLLVTVLFNGAIYQANPTLIYNVRNEKGIAKN